MRVPHVPRLVAWIALFLLLPAHAGRAQSPAKLGVASGELVGRRHTFSWVAVPDVPWYYLWVQQPLGIKFVDVWYTAAQAGCASGEPVCAVTIDMALHPGEIRWWIGTWRPTPAVTVWSNPQTVRVLGAGTIALSFLLANTFVGERAGGATTTGANNTATGAQAMEYNTTGQQNTALGWGALRFNVDGQNNTAIGYAALTLANSHDNTAVGASALAATTIGHSNTAAGSAALRLNTTGSTNTAVGFGALEGNTVGDGNVAVGAGALGAVCCGSGNIAIGRLAGSSFILGNNILIGHAGVAGDASTIRIGTDQLRTFIAGIRGVTTDLNDAAPVLIDSAGQLGTMSSSRRVKQNIADLGAVSERVQRLRPVQFQYARPFADGSKPTQYGLIAEEVEQVLPELVAYGADGRPETVKYHVLPTLLLGEVQRLERRRAAQSRDIDVLKRQLQDLADAVAQLEAGR